MGGKFFFFVFDLVIIILKTIIIIIVGVDKVDNYSFYIFHEFYFLFIFPLLSQNKEK